MSSMISRPQVVGTVIFEEAQPATATECWVDLLVPNEVGLHDLLVIDSPSQLIVGQVTDIHAHTPRASSHTNGTSSSHRSHTIIAKLALLGFSDQRQRPPLGSRVRVPEPTEITNILGDARRILQHRQVPSGVVSLRSGFAPIMLDLDRIVGPVATTLLVSGAAGSLKSTSGMLLALSIQRVTNQQAAIVIVNSKGSDFLFADYSRQRLNGRFGFAPLSERDIEMYRALGFEQPPALQDATFYVPDVRDSRWRSPRPVGFPRTVAYQLSHAAAIRYALAPTDDDEQLTSGITRQCIETAAGPFAKERSIRHLSELVVALEGEYELLTSERARWRSQFQQKTVGAALRQLATAERDLGFLTGNIHQHIAFPVEQLANGGVMVVDVSSLHGRAAQAVIDELVTSLWTAKASGALSSTLPLLLMIDELNRWKATSPTARHLSAVVRDQRHRRFGVIGLCQQLSSLNDQILANADGFWYGTTRSSELIQECYAHLPLHIRSRLHRLADGNRILDAWPLAEPITVTVPFPNWLISDEGLTLVEAWNTKQESIGRA